MFKSSLNNNFIRWTLPGSEKILKQNVSQFDDNIIQPLDQI